LRTDPSRVREALEGRATVAEGYALGQLPVTTAYFPVRGKDGAVSFVLALEAGQAFEAARAALSRSLWTGVALSLLVGLVLAVLALLWARAEAERRATAERAARGEALSRIAAAAAHEIRNPLSVIRGNVELVQLRQEDVLTEGNREAMRDILGEVERLKQLTEDLIDLSADRALASERVELGALLGDVGRAVKRTHPKADVVIDAATLSVRGDAGRLRQVLLNLAQNAAQSGAARVTLRAQRREGLAALVVEDDGPGIPEAVRGRLFEPFVTSKANGTGLGLAVSRRLVERHGGQLRLLESAKGSTFELLLKVED
jgi:signal transduction histidine kinase